MSDVTIRVDGISKEYVIGARQNGYRTFREALVDSITGPIQRLRALRNRAPPEQRFWALNNVSFDVRAGEVVGVVGRNGAGKSTLLKILSRITAPTQGRVILRGRVASLLEVGTGFHPELTGRENIYLNGAILGMTRAEIRRKFDEMVAFAEVEKFLDTPVKHYSSGMYVRLAFAVAAHLDPDILLVDEVLAVGDADFQKKSLGKLKQISETGQTVLFVSHNLSAIGALCQKGIYIQHGRLVETGPIHEVLAAYIRGGAVSSQVERSVHPDAEAALVRGGITYEPGGPGALPHLRVDLTIFALRDMTTSVDFRLKDVLGVPIGFGSLGALHPAEMVPLRKGLTAITVALPAGNLASGAYTLSIDLTNPEVSFYDRAEDCMSVNIEPIVTMGAIRPLKQAWGYGSVTLMASLIENVEKNKDLSKVAALSE